MVLHRILHEILKVTNLHTLSSTDLRNTVSRRKPDINLRAQRLAECGFLYCNAIGNNLYVNLTVPEFFIQLTWNVFFFSSFPTQTALQPIRTCVSCRLMRAWSAASPGTAWWWPTQSAAVTTAVAGGPSVTPVHPETQVGKPGCTAFTANFFFSCVLN